MSKKRWKTNSGLTLVEILVVMSILSIFAIFLVSLVITSQNAWMVQNTSVPVRAEVKRAMETMVKEFREADPSAPGGIAISGANNSQITFSVPNQVSQAGILSWRQIQFSYDQIQRQVIRTENGANTVLGRNVQSLQFAQANNIVSATVGTSVTTMSGMIIQSTLTSQAKVRN
ncbi:MAG: type II secretion system protein [Candidatus Omnitrophica bacterium]|nr:type II secretion system protein [Candidatus Omnitrophota bacterium]